MKNPILAVFQMTLEEDRCFALETSQSGALELLAISA